MSTPLMSDSTPPISDFRAISPLSYIGALTFSEMFGHVTLFITFAGTFGAFRFPPRRFAALTMFLAGLCFLLSDRERFQRVHIPVFPTAFLAWFSISFFWSRNIFGWGDLFFSGVVPAMAVVIVMACTPTLALRRSLVLLAALMLPYTIGHTILNFTSSTANVDAISGLNTPGWRGSFVHKNTFATFGTVAAAIMLNLPKRTWIKVIGAGGWIALIFLSQALTGLIGLGAVLVSFVISSGLSRTLKRHRITYMFGVSSVGLVAGSGVFLAAPSLASLFGKDPTLTGRTKIWKAASRLIAHEPLVGYGGGGLWGDQSAEPTRGLVREVGFTIFHAHNGYYEVLLQLGLVGLILWGLSSIALIARVSRCIELDRPFVTCSFGIVTAMLLMSISEALVFGPWPVLLVVLSTLARRLGTDTSIRDWREDCVSASL